MKKTLLVLSAFIFGVTAVVAHSGVMTGWEIQFFSAIYTWPIWLLPIMLVITMTGSSWMVASLTTYLLYKKRLSLALQVLLVGMSTYVAAEIAKQIVARPRPFLLLNSVHGREPHITGQGFPSGHTAVVAAIAFLLYQFLPRDRRNLVFAWVGLVALSRIYLGVHAPLDVIGGAALGVVVFQLFLLVKPKLSRWSKH